MTGSVLRNLTTVPLHMRETRLRSLGQVLYGMVCLLDMDIDMDMDIKYTVCYVLGPLIYQHPCQ
jgi:hypothetical protein